MKIRVIESEIQGLRYVDKISVEWEVPITEYAPILVRQLYTGENAYYQFAYTSMGIAYYRRANFIEVTDSDRKGITDV